jgi:hypothetical protein
VAIDLDVVVDPDPAHAPFGEDIGLGRQGLERAKPWTCSYSGPHARLALVFTAGIGEHAPEIRSRSCARCGSDMPRRSTRRSARYSAQLWMRRRRRSFPTSSAKAT